MYGGGNGKRGNGAGLEKGRLCTKLRRARRRGIEARCAEVGATRLLGAKAVSIFTLRVGERGGAYRRDAFPDLTFEAQIGLTELGAFLAELANLCALYKQQERRQRDQDCARRGLALADLRTTSIIWLNIASTLGALGPDEGSAEWCGTKRRENDMMAQKKKDGQGLKKQARIGYYKLA